VTYDARCDACPFLGEISKPMADDFPTTCPGCGDSTLCQDFRGKSFIIQDKSPKSYGQQSDLNRKALGGELSAKKDEALAALRPKAETPWWREEGSKPLDTSKIKDLTHFVETGETS
jgi:predicted nucleic acid-binding Zn ribbon protein